MFSICFKIETCSVYVIHTNELAVFFFTVFVGTLILGALLPSVDYWTRVKPQTGAPQNPFS